MRTSAKKVASNLHRGFGVAGSLLESQLIGDPLRLMVPFGEDAPPGEFIPNVAATPGRTPSEGSPGARRVHPAVHRLQLPIVPLRDLSLDLRRQAHRKGLVLKDLPLFGYGDLDVPARLLEIFFPQCG